MHLLIAYGDYRLFSLDGHGSPSLFFATHEQNLRLVITSVQSTENDDFNFYIYAVGIKEYNCRHIFAVVGRIYEKNQYCYKNIKMIDISRS